MTQPINLENLIASEAAQQGVPPALALAVATQESGLNQGAVGSAGEIGVFQLMPSSFPGQDIGDVYTNVSLGVGYLAKLLSQYGGNQQTALAAYNWGPGNVNKALSSGASFPAVVWAYIQSVLGMAGSSSSASTAYAAGSAIADTSPDGSASIAALPGVASSWLSDPTVLPLVIVGGALLLWWALE